MKHRMVLVIWRDATAYLDLGWQPAEEYQRLVAVDRRMVHTIGWEVVNDQDSVAVAQSWEPALGGMSDVIQIPMGMVKEVIVLETR